MSAGEGRGGWEVDWAVFTQAEEKVGLSDHCWWRIRWWSWAGWMATLCDVDRSSCGSWITFVNSGHSYQSVSCCLLKIHTGQSLDSNTRDNRPAGIFHRNSCPCVRFVYGWETIGGGQSFTQLPKCQSNTVLLSSSSICWHGNCSASSLRLLQSCQLLAMGKVR